MFDLRIKDGVARLTLQRPKSRNAVPASEWPLLAAAAEEAERSAARILILAGEGDAFCAGADISDFAAMREHSPSRAQLRTGMRQACDKLRSLNMPTVAVIDGPCFGAGAALAMACDIRLAGAGAQFAITPAKMGISFPQEDIHRLVSLIGPGQAARLLFTGRTIDGPEAERVGLVERFAGAGLPAVVDNLVTAVLANSTSSLQTLKRGLTLAAAGIAHDDEQDRMFDALLGSEELAERLSRLRTARGR